MLRATTGFEVRGPADQAGITVTLRATTQFDAGCMVGATLSMPSAPRFMFSVPVSGRDANGRAVAPLMGSGQQVLEITGFDTTGATLVDVSFLSPCEALVLAFGPAQCRMGESVAAEACPYLVTYIAPPTLLGVEQIGTDGAQSPAQGDRDAGATDAASPDFTPIDLGGRDADDIIDLLFPQN